MIEALALEKLEVETEQDCTLPPMDRQRKKIGHLADEFWKAHSYKGENTSAIQQQKASAERGISIIIVKLMNKKLDAD